MNWSAAFTYLPLIKLPDGGKRSPKRTS